MKKLAPLAEKGKINADASIRDSQSVIINAPCDKVWNALADIPNWPQWHPDISSVKIDQVAEGASFTWIINGTTIKSTIRSIKEKEMISWTGKAFGMKAIHVWKVEETDGDQTIVTTEESLQGLSTLFYSHQKLHKSLLEWLEHLRQLTEGELTA